LSEGQAVPNFRANSTQQEIVYSKDLINFTVIPFTVSPDEENISFLFQGIYCNGYLVCNHSPDVDRTALSVRYTLGESGAITSGDRW